MMSLLCSSCIVLMVSFSISNSSFKPSRVRDGCLCSTGVVLVGVVGDGCSEEAGVGTMKFGLLVAVGEAAGFCAGCWKLDGLFDDMNDGLLVVTGTGLLVVDGVDGLDPGTVGFSFGGGGLGLPKVDFRLSGCMKDFGRTFDSSDTLVSFSCFIDTGLSSFACTSGSKRDSTEFLLLFDAGNSGSVEDAAVDKVLSTDADFGMVFCLGMIGARTDDCLVFFKLDNQEGACGAASSFFSSLTATGGGGFFCDCLLLRSLSQDGFALTEPVSDVDVGMTGTPPFLTGSAEVGDVADDAIADDLLFDDIGDDAGSADGVITGSSLMDVSVSVTKFSVSASLALFLLPVALGFFLFFGPAALL